MGSAARFGAFGGGAWPGLVCGAGAFAGWPHRLAAGALGPFDLDPCSPILRPWDTAKYHYTVSDNGFIKEWFGRVWLNPPYGRGMYEWMNKLAAHGNGIGLIFARTDTKGFQNHILSDTFSDIIRLLDYIYI